MRFSYKVLKKYLPYLKDPQKTAQDLIMHTAEVEKVDSQKKDFENIVVGKIISIKKHPDADFLRVCQVDVGEKDNLQIVCGGLNLRMGQKVAVAKPGASVMGHGQQGKVVIKETKIRGVESFGMICSSKEIGLEKEFPAKDDKEILDLSFLKVKIGTNLASALGKDDEIIEIDNKAINHRPDMFSYIGVLRELAAISGKSLKLSYKSKDFSFLPRVNVENLIPEVVKRYSVLEISGVGNKTSNKEIKAIIEATGHETKGLLIDLSNYSLYFYGQPAHIFDADKIRGRIIIRYAKSGETFEALDGKTYKLSDNDIVVADEEKILALGGIIGGKSGAVCESTNHILIETAHFDQATLRLTGKRLGIRTDSLNLFEKNIPTELASYATALIVDELMKEYPNLKLLGYTDIYPTKQEIIVQDFDLDFYNDLIGANYSKKYVDKILKNLGISRKGNSLIIPFWRNDLTSKADIAEEIARIDGYDKIKAVDYKINLGAITQDTVYYLKNDAKKYFVSVGFFEVYNYSFVNKNLMLKLNLDTSLCVPLKNFLSEDGTHLRNSLIPNLMKGLESNIKERKNIKLFEIEKVFFNKNGQIGEDYFLSGVITSSKDIVYYDIQNIVSDFFSLVFADDFFFDKAINPPKFAHAGRVAEIIMRGERVGFVGEIHPLVAKRFDVDERVGFFELEVSKLIPNLYKKVKAKEISIFQENNFDLSFVVDKDVKGREIMETIKGVNKSLIQKVELFDVYEDEKKLPGKRSLSFRVYIQSMTETLKDEVKAGLIKEIVEEVQKKGGSLR